MLKITSIAKEKSSISNRLTVKRALLENTVKHLVIIFITTSVYGLIYNELEIVKLSSIGDFLSLISILLVTVCFANFASSYEITDISKHWMRVLSQCASFAFILLIAILLETMVIGIKFVYPLPHRLFLIFPLFLFSGIVLYDYWDFVRCFARRPK